MNQVAVIRLVVGNRPVIHPTLWEWKIPHVVHVHILSMLVAMSNQVGGVTCSPEFLHKILCDSLVSLLFLKPVQPGDEVTSDAVIYIGINIMGCPAVRMLHLLLVLGAHLDCVPRFFQDLWTVTESSINAAMGFAKHFFFITFHFKDLEVF